MDRFVCSKPHSLATISPSISTSPFLVMMASALRPDGGSTTEVSSNGALYYDAIYGAMFLVDQKHVSTRFVFAFCFHLPAKRAFSTFIPEKIVDGKLQNAPPSFKSDDDKLLKFYKSISEC
jgi:hypothetical protein